MGYWIENFDGDYTFVEYEKRPIEGGYMVTQLDGSEVPIMNPVIEQEEFEPEKFDAEGAIREQD